MVTILKLLSPEGVMPVIRKGAVSVVLVAGVLLTACTGLNSSTAVVAQGSANGALVKPGNAESAILSDLHGTVEVKTGDSQWTVAESGQTLKVGQDIRTGALSNVTLAYYDNSRMFLGAETEIILDVLDARTSGARVVELTQLSGESQHEVATSDDPGSHYNVNTPAGNGSATGSKFTVAVRPDQLSQFWIDEGLVSVVNADVTVMVVAGQTTIVLLGQPPTEPAFRVSGEGQVMQIETVNGGGGVLAALPPAPENQNDKITLCHATGSATNPYVEITVSAQGATNGHAKHAGDIIPAPAGGCPQASATLTTQNVKVTVCHATGSMTNPYVAITVSVQGATNGHAKHAGDILPAPADGCPKSTPASASTSATWNLAGQTFTTGTSTVIFGNPQPGDWVRFEGHLQSDGSRYADRMVVVNYSSENQFAFIGIVQSVNDSAWTISGRTVQVDEFTAIEAGLGTGDTVQVVGSVTEDGRFWATRINRTEGAGSNFRFAGILGSLDNDVWVISGIKVTVAANTTLEGDFVLGNPVVVEGVIKEDGTWLVTSINLVTSEGYRFQFIGVVQNLSPWTVSGVSFDVADWTEIDADIKVGNKVRVTGTVSADGLWVAERIERLDTEHSTSFDFFGPVVSINPWNVRGIPLTVDERTTVKGDITVGEMVKVTGWILEDGTWLATEIKHTGLHLGQGCFTVNTVVQSVNGDQIILTDGQTLVRSEALEVEGDLKEASAVVYQYCVDKDGVGKIGHVSVMYQLNMVPVTGDVSAESGKAVICHIPPGNPGNMHTIEVGQPAVAAHLAHGDTLGPCPNEKPDKPKDDQEDK